MKIDFSKVELKDLEGKVVKDPNLHKTIANAIYAHTQDLDLVEKARIINSGKEVEFDKTEIEEVKRVIKDPKTGFFAFAQKALLDALDAK
jgi:hypothetical protein